MIDLDGSNIARDALLWGSKLAADPGAEVLALNCFWSPLTEAQPQVHERLLAARERALTGVWIAPASDAGAKVSTALGQGDPRHVLLAMAEAEGAELLVVGRTGAGDGRFRRCRPSGGAVRGVDARAKSTTASPPDHQW